MDLITDNLFLIIVLIAGAISQWLKSRGESQNENQDPGDFYPEEYEEAPRRNYEAPVPPIPPQMPRSTVYLPTYDVGSELARQAEINEKIQALKSGRNQNKKAPTKHVKKATTAQLSKIKSPSIRETLNQKSELRKAILLREILDKPISLR